MTIPFKGNNQSDDDASNEGRVDEKTGKLSVMDVDLEAGSSNFSGNQTYGGNNYDGNTSTDAEANSSFSNDLDLTDPQNNDSTNNNEHSQDQNPYDFNGQTTRPNKASAQEEQQQDYGGFSNTLNIINEMPSGKSSHDGKTDSSRYDASNRYTNSNSNYDGSYATQDHQQQQQSSSGNFANALDDGNHDKPGEGRYDGGTSNHAAHEGDNSASTWSSSMHDGNLINNIDDNETRRRRIRRRRCAGGVLGGVVIAWLLFGGLGRGYRYGTYNDDTEDTADEDGTGNNSTVAPSLAPTVASTAS